ncbi:23149_t:CDS:1, partial [Racocetra persica]
RFSLQNLLGFPEEKVNNIVNINQIIEQYQISLSDKLSITPQNIDKIQKALLEGINKYYNDDDKKLYLTK